MKLFKVAKRGPDRELGASMGSGSTLDSDNNAINFRIYFYDAEGESLRYSVEMERAEAMKLRDTLNKRFPESCTETLGTVLNRRKNLS